MLFGQDRDDLRQMYVDAFDKARQGHALSPLEAQIAEVIEAHPEYHGQLTADAASEDYSPQRGRTNPFLHMGLHLALRDQLHTDRPPGIRALYGRIAAKNDDTHDVEHRMIDCLAETLWEAQNAGAAPDEARYLQRLQRLAG